jgi:hypothetical protein
VNSTQDLGQPVADRKNHHQHKLVGHRDNLSPEALQETRQDRRFRRQSSLSEPRHVSTAVIMALRATIKPRIAAERPATPLVTWRACLMKPAASARGSLTQIRRPDPESDFPGSRAVPTSFFARDDQRADGVNKAVGRDRRRNLRQIDHASHRPFPAPGTQGGSRRLPGGGRSLENRSPPSTANCRKIRSQTVMA